VDDAEIADGVYFYRDVVARDDVLRRNVESFDAQAYALKRFDGPEDEVDAGSLCLRQQTAQAQDYAAFPLFDDVDGIPEPDQDETDDDHRSDAEFKHVRASTGALNFPQYWGKRKCSSLGGWRWR